MLLYGCSLIYGFTGNVSFAGIAKASAHGGIGLVFGLVFLFAGFCFKVSAVPFHMYFDEPAKGFNPVPGELKAVLGVAGLFNLLYFLYPAPLITAAGIAAKSLF